MGAIIIAIKVQQQRDRRQHTLGLAELHALSPRELELHVAQVIATLPGWTATVNWGSADQGADVIANGPKGRKVAVQVKHYANSNVGNKAVQEIVAFKSTYRCGYAVVVTSGPGYTRAAQELAKAGQVPPHTLLPT